MLRNCRDISQKLLSQIVSCRYNTFLSINMDQISLPDLLTTIYNSYEDYPYEINQFINIFHILITID